MVSGRLKNKYSFRQARLLQVVGTANRAANENQKDLTPVYRFVFTD